MVNLGLGRTLLKDIEYVDNKKMYLSKIHSTHTLIKSAFGFKDLEKCPHIKHILMLQMVQKL